MRSLPSRAALAALALSVVVPLAAPAPAQAEPMFVAWSDELPAWTTAYEPSSENDCQAGRITCVDRAARDMQRRYDDLLATCDHNAVFGLAYLRTTQEYGRSAVEPGFYRDAAFVNHEDAVFAQFYFSAFDAWADRDPGTQAPEVWRIAFDAARDRRVTGSGNLLLGMHAHVQRDLPFVLANIGLVAPDGSSRKADHDAVNRMLNRVVEPLLAEAAARLDPTMDDAGTPYGLSYTTLMQLLVTWRENAWRNAERLVTAPGPAARAQVAQSIESAAAEQARLLVLQSSYLPLQNSRSRDAFCAAGGDGAP